MPKKPFYESAIHHLLLAAKAIADTQRVISPKEYAIWKEFLNSCEFSYVDAKTVRVDWTYPKDGTLTFSIEDVWYYTRGDTPETVNTQKQKKLPFKNDAVYTHNALYFQTIVRKMAKKAGIKIKDSSGMTHHEQAKMHDEEVLSDEWALSVRIEDIDVIQTNTAVTSPELRFIHRYLGPVEGKRIIDIGSGLGEVSVYFALRGANVTALDVSRPMLSVTEQLAQKHGVHVNTVQASVEHIALKTRQPFDIVYVGNVFHHVDIPSAVREIKKILKPDGTLIMWEPVHYNPVINIYRRMANTVRSHDERPFRLSDIKYFQSHFDVPTIRSFWLTTLLLFIIMFLSGRNPNKERYWKSVIKEEKRWKPLFVRLKRLDDVLLRLFPFLGLLCWNVVLVCKMKKETKR